MSEILWPLAVVAVVAAFGGLVGGGVVLSLRRQAARADEDWRRWSAEHGWHHVATSPDVLRPPAVRSPTPAQQRGLIARDLTKAVVEVDGLRVDAATLVLDPRGWPRRAWEDQLGALPEVATAFLTALITSLPADLPSATRHRPGEPRLSGIARYLADTTGSAPAEVA